MLNINWRKWIDNQQVEGYVNTAISASYIYVLCIMDCQSLYSITFIYKILRISNNYGFYYSTIFGASTTLSSFEMDNIYWW